MAEKKWLKTHGLNVAEGELQLSCLIAATTHDNSGVVLYKTLLRQRFQLEVEMVFLINDCRQRHFLIILEQKRNISNAKYF